MAETTIDTCARTYASYMEADQRYMAATTPDELERSYAAMMGSRQAWTAAVDAHNAHLNQVRLLAIGWHATETSAHPAGCRCLDGRHS